MKIDLSKFTKPLTEEEHEELIKVSKKGLEIDEKTVVFTEKSIHRLFDSFNKKEDLF